MLGLNTHKLGILAFNEMITLLSSEPEFISSDDCDRISIIAINRVLKTYPELSELVASELSEPIDLGYFESMIVKAIMNQYGVSDEKD